MILTTHALAGAAIGKTISDPWIIIPTAIVIHFILDFFRHGEYFDRSKETARAIGLKVATDLIVGFSIILFLISLDFAVLNLQNIFLGTFFGMFPDLITAIFWGIFPNSKILKKITDFHAFCHCYSRFPKSGPERAWTFQNARNDIIFSLIAIIIFLFL